MQSAAASNITTLQRTCFAADHYQESESVDSVLSVADHRLLNGRQLGERLNVKYDFVKDMRLAGFQPPIAGLTTLSYAIEWLNKNPDFRGDARILKLSRKPRSDANHQLQVSGKSGSLRLKRGGQHSARLLLNAPL